MITARTVVAVDFDSLKILQHGQIFWNGGDTLVHIPMSAVIELYAVADRSAITYSWISRFLGIPYLSTAHVNTYILDQCLGPWGEDDSRAFRI